MVMETAVTRIDGKITTLRVVSEKKPKLRADGSPKQTKNNCSVERWVDPIRIREDIEKVKRYLLDSVADAGNLKAEKSRYVKYMLFVCGINFGLRIGDLLATRWKEIILPSGKPKDRFTRKQEKTGKVREIYINGNAKAAIAGYIERFGLPDSMESYVFSATGKSHMSDTAVGNFLKEATAACEIEGNYYTHSLRKTFAYNMYMMLMEANDPLALAKVQNFLNHRNQIDTLRYLGLSQKADSDLVESMNL